MRIPILHCLFLILFLPFAIMAQDCFEDQPTAGGDCSSAKFLCGYNFDDFVDTLSNDPLQGDQPVDLCNSSGDVDNIEWYSFIACESDVELLITPITCTPGSSSQFGLQTGIYEDCSFTNALFCYSAPGVNPITIALSDLIPGDIYYLFVDGYAGSICEFRFNVISGINTDEPSQPATVDVPLVAERDTICAGETTVVSFEIPDLSIGGYTCGGSGGQGEYSESDLDYIACFNWLVNGIPDDATIALADAFDIIYTSSTSAEIVFYNPGNYSVDVEMDLNPAVFGGSVGACTAADINFIPVDITVLEPVLEVLPEIVLCEGETFEFCGTIYTTSTVAQCIKQCSTFVQPIVFTPSTYTDLGSYYICDSECFEFQNVQYCNTGSYDIVDEDDCTMRSTFAIINLNASIVYAGEDEFNCDIESITLNPIYSINNNATLNYQWTDASNTPLGNEATLDIFTAGTYTVVVTADDIVSGCTISHTIIVTESSNVPSLTIDSPILTCDNPSEVIMVSSDVAVQSATWLGPNNTLISNELSPTVSEVGKYTVSITGINGCTTTEEVFVTSDLSEPSLLLDYRDIDCNVEVIEATYTTDVAIRSQQWSGPEAISDDASIMISQAGNYLLTVTGYNGCQTSETFVINDLKELPIVDAGPNLLWNCNTESLDIKATIPSGTQFQYEWNLLSGDPFVEVGNDQITCNSLGEYEIVVTNTNLGCVARDTVKITENPDVPTAIDREFADPLCYTSDNGYILIESVTGGSAPYTLTINEKPILVSEMLSDLSDGTYDLAIVDNNGCSYTEEVILVKPQEIILDAPTEVEIKYYSNGTLELDYDIDDAEVEEINWYNRQGELIGEGESIEFNEKHSTYYTVELITIDGCMVSQEIEIRVDTSVDIYAPNIFSPNGDGSNDIFWIHGEDRDIMIESLLIYDRWGGLVYEAEDMPVGESSRGWNGKFNGQDVNPGVYVYILEIRTSAEELLVKTGDITVVR